MAVAVTFTATLYFSTVPGKAVEIPFVANGQDYTTYVATINGPGPVNINGSAGDVVNFALSIDSPDVTGSFTLEIYSDPGFPSGDLLGSIFLLSAPLMPGTSNFGSINLPGVPFDFMAETNQWSFTLDNTTPLYVYVFSGLTIDDVTPFTATLSYEVAESPDTVPLPGSLPLFAAGIGVFGLVARRRHKLKSISTV